MRWAVVVSGGVVRVGGGLGGGEGCGGVWLVVGWVVAGAVAGLPGC